MALYGKEIDIAYFPQINLSSNLQMGDILPLGHEETSFPVSNQG
jgi:hypothetical protein